MELDPRNGEVAVALGDVYLQTHRYNEFQQLITRAAASGALENPTSQQLLAQMKLKQGDPVAAQSLLDQVPLDYSPGGWIWGVRFTVAWYLRDYDAANRVMAATPARCADEIFVASQPPLRVLITVWLRVRAAIGRRRWRRLQPRAKRWKRNGATRPRMRPTSWTLRTTSRSSR